MSTIEDEARAEAEKLWPDDEDHTVMAVRHVMRAGYVNGYLAASRREPSGATARKAIADAVRHHCTLTPNPMSGPYPLDATVQAVADWIENPPEWVRFPSESTAVGASDGTSKSNANDLDREPSANVSNRPKDDISSGEMSVSEPSDTDEREAALIRWLVETLHYPFDVTFAKTPPVSLDALADYWNEHDEWGVTPQEARAMIRDQAVWEEVVPDGE